MRDINRLKEKYELSLDNRHVVGLTVAGLVVVGSVFVLGVTVGKRLAADERALQAPDLLSTLDQKAAQAAADSAADASLTFQEELTKKAPPPLPPPPLEEPPKVVVAPAPVPTTPAPPAPAPVPEPKAVEPKVAEAPKVQDMIKNVGLRADDVVTTRIARDAGALKDAINRAAQKSPEPAPTGGSWALQLSAYQDREEAMRFAAGLKDKGYSPYIVEAHVDGKGTWYRVRMGRFPSREAATRYLNDFKRETQLDAFVTGGQ